LQKINLSLQKKGGLEGRQGDGSPPEAVGQARATPNWEKSSTTSQVVARACGGRVYENPIIQESGKGFGKRHL